MIYGSTKQEIHLKTKAFYELIDILKGKVNDKKVSDFIERYSLDEVLFAFKGNGFGVNAYPSSKSYNKYLKFHSKLYVRTSTRMETAELDKYDKDIERWNLLFDDYYSSDQLKEVSLIDDEKKLYAFLIVFEIYIRGLNDLRFNNGENKDFYGEIDLHKVINGKIKGVNDLTANQFTDAIDYIFQQSSKVVQSFIFHGYLYENNKFIYCPLNEEIDWDDINMSIDYFSLIDKRNVLFDAFEDWKFGDYELFCHDDNKIEIRPKSVKKLISEKIENQRFESFRQSTMLDFKGINDEKEKDVEISSNLLPPKGYLNEQEKVSYDEYLEYFSSQHLDYKVDGVEIVKWLRAYAVIRYVNSNFIKNQEFPDSRRLESWIYVSTLDDWIKKFVEFGIDEKSANIICNRLKFKKDSIDWFDAPFIEIGEKIITVPSYASRIQDVLALISLATKDNININFKGYCFEERVLTDLNKNMIPAVSLKRKVGNEEYQCDVAFILGTNLFLCECKHTAQPATQRKRYDFYNRNVPEDVIQMNRISDFYSSNIEHVLEEINKKNEHRYPSDWKPKCIYRMIIYSSKITSNMNVDGVIITDYTIFATLLYKRLPTYLVNGKPPKSFMPPKMESLYRGALTTNKLLKFIENPWQVDFQRETTKVEDEIIPINKLYLQKKKIFKTLDNFYDLGK